MALITIEEGIYYKLANTAAVSAIVGTRIYPLTLPQTPTLPALTYQLITPMSIIAHDGKSGTAQCRYQITGFDDDPDILRDLMEEVRICMDGFKGSIGGADTITVQAMLPEGGYESYDPETGRYMRARDLMIWYNEPTA